MSYKIVLENIRSAWNVGSIMRTCDALGFELILVGYTPRPEGKSLELIKKTSIGAENTVAWEYFTVSRLVFEKYSEFSHLGIDILPGVSVDIIEFFSSSKPYENSLLWFGNEISGLSHEVQNNCNRILHLPMKGKKESLNVANSVTAVGYIFIAREKWF